MTDPDLRARLFQSPAVQSLVAERAVAAAIATAGWTVAHGCYYRDPESGKMRETDVVGRRGWMLRDGRLLRFGQVNLVVEVKTMRGFHIAFVPLEAGPRLSPRIDEWVGREGKNQERLREVLRPRVTFDGMEEHLRDSLTRLAYPDGESLIARLLPSPPEPPARGAAFRETNIGGEKELENSVMWRASLALQSAVQSLRQRSLEITYENLELEARMAEENGGVLLWSSPEDVQGSLARCDVFHPVLVLDAGLWELETSSVRDVKWFRFEQLDSHGNSEWWCDVVHAGNLNEFVVALSGHYAAAFEAVGAEPLR